jgi:hypothetical protein
MLICKSISSLMSSDFKLRHFYSVISSRFSHPINSAILANVCKSGWCMLVHHLLTVTAETTNCSANHLLVFWFSTRTTLSRLRGLSFIFIKLNSSANIIKECDITKFISNHLSIFQFGESLYCIVPKPYISNCDH